MFNMKVSKNVVEQLESIAKAIDLEFAEQIKPSNPHTKLLEKLSKPYELSKHEDVHVNKMLTDREEMRILVQTLIQGDEGVENDAEALKILDEISTSIEETDSLIALKLHEFQIKKSIEALRAA